MISTRFNAGITLKARDAFNKYILIFTATALLTLTKELNNSAFFIHCVKRIKQHDILLHRVKLFFEAYRILFTWRKEKLAFRVY